MAEKKEEWAFEEISHLIDVWSEQECLYSLRSSDYGNKQKKAEAMDNINKYLQKNGINKPMDSILSKMQSLRVYYSSRFNKMYARQQRNDGKVKDIPVRWPFFKKMSFLNGNFTVRTEPSGRKRRLQPVFAKSPETSTSSCLLLTNGSHLQQQQNQNPSPVDTSYIEQQPEMTSSADGDDTDDLFCKMLKIQLKQLPFSTREFVKHEISGIMLKAKFQSTQSDVELTGNNS